MDHKFVLLCMNSSTEYWILTFATKLFSSEWFIRKEKIAFLRKEVLTRDRKSLMYIISFHVYLSWVFKDCFVHGWRKCLPAWRVFISFLQHTIFARFHGGNFEPCSMINPFIIKFYILLTSEALLEYLAYCEAWFYKLFLEWKLEKSTILVFYIEIVSKLGFIL